MADHADNNFDGDVFIYRGGRAPQHITHALIDESIDEIEDNAFNNCQNLLMVDTHNGIRRIGNSAFYECKSLRLINLKSIRRIGRSAFNECRSLRMINLKSAVAIGAFSFCGCTDLLSVEFGDRLEIISGCAFAVCISLQHLKLPSIITIEACAFDGCTKLLDVELSERLETIGASAFSRCWSLKRIAMPLKRDLFKFSYAFSYAYEKYNQFDNCKQLTIVDLVGGVHKTVASLHMEEWRRDMSDEISEICTCLCSIRTDYPRVKSRLIKWWLASVLNKLNEYKARHCRYVKEAMSLLELALWKAKLTVGEAGASSGSVESERQSKKIKVDGKVARKEKRLLCSADIVIKNVLPFLELES